MGLEHAQERIPEATLQRLPLYLYRLLSLQGQGVGRVSSRALAAELRINSSRLRQDFHHFGGFSRPGQTYAVDHLVARLREILALGAPVQYVIAGAGYLGQAIAAYPRFEEDGFRLAGIFDINPKLIGLRFRGVPVQDIELLPELVARLGVRLGVITTSPEAAQKVAEFMVRAGITGIWNFAPVSLQLPDQVTLQDEFLTAGLMALHYRMHEAERQGEESA